MLQLVVSDDMYMDWDNRLGLKFVPCLTGFVMSQILDVGHWIVDGQWIWILEFCKLCRFVGLRIYRGDYVGS